eukprot:3084297-Prymnesium_polylepis.1
MNFARRERRCEGQCCTVSCEECEPEKNAGLCLVCLETSTSGLTCSLGDLHFVCKQCVQHFVRSILGTEELRTRKGGLPCVAADDHCSGPLWKRTTAFDRSQVEPLIDTELHAAYCAAINTLPPTATMIDTTISAAPVSDMTIAAAPISFAAVAELLNVTCPSCSKFVDPSPDGCIAMCCAHCRKPFCWMCLEAVPGTDAHGHCMEAHRSYFPPLRHVAAWHRVWRWQRVLRLLPDAVKSSPDAVD